MTEWHIMILTSGQESQADAAAMAKIGVMNEMLACLCFPGQNATVRQEDEFRSGRESIEIRYHGLPLGEQFPWALAQGNHSTRGCQQQACKATHSPFTLYRTWSGWRG